MGGGECDVWEGPSHHIATDLICKERLPSEQFLFVAMVIDALGPVMGDDNIHFPRQLSGESDKQSREQSHEQSHEQSREQSHEQSHEQSREQSREQSHEQSREQSHEQSREQSCEQSHEQSREQSRDG